MTLTAGAEAESGADAPPGRLWRALLLAAVAACAACGLIYELALLALSASLGRGDVVATSVIVAGYVAALGLGALLAKPLVKWAAASFLGVEAALGLVGGFSATLLYLSFAVTGDSLAALTVATIAIGVLVGAEVPLLMTLLQHGRRTTAAESGAVVANLNAADYLGALIGGLSWPFIVLPVFGMLRGTAVTGLINVAAALLIAVLLLRRMLTRRVLVAAVSVLVAAAVALVALLFSVRHIEVTARQALFAAPIVHAERSDYQEIVITRSGKDNRLFLDGGLQYSSRDEYRYTESLVYPALRESTRTALILGGGDGLAARELLRMPGIERIVQVELDPRVIELARTELAADNGGSLDDPRVDVVVDDAFAWLRGHSKEPRNIPAGGFDAIYADLPDPDTAVLGRLYSQEFYGLMRGVAAPGARPARAWSSNPARRSPRPTPTGAPSPPCAPRAGRPRRTTSTSRPSATGASGWRNPAMRLCLTPPCLTTPPAPTPTDPASNCRPVPRRCATSPTTSPPPPWSSARTPHPAISNPAP